TRRVCPRLQPRHALRQVSAENSEYAALWLSAVGRPRFEKRREEWRAFESECQKRKGLPLQRHPEVSRKEFRGIEFRRLPRVDDAVYVRDAMQRLPRQAPAPRISCC